MNTDDDTPRLNPESTLRVVVADDHPLIRDGWRMVLDTLPEAVLVGSAATGSEAIRLVAEQHPHVVVMDLHMPELDGVEATRRITASNPSVAVLVLTQYDDDDSITAALRAGARGYVLKGAGATELVLALRAVAAGQVTFGSELSKRLLDRITGTATSPPKAAFPELTPRELEVLKLLAEGLSDSRIARQLVVEAKTVRNHIGNILPKLRAATRIEAVLMARNAGLGTSDADNTTTPR